MISNIRPGNYRLFALKDLNGNFMYDLADEIFAFGDSVVSITPDNYFGLVPDTITYRPASATETTKPDKFVYGLHRLYAFQEPLKQQYLTFTERKSSWGISFGLALPADSGQVSVTLPDADTSSWYMEHNIARDTFMIWVTNPDLYNRDLVDVILTFPFTDTTGAIIAKTDTISFRYMKPSTPRGGTGRAPGLNITTNISGRVRPGIVPLFQSVTPFAEPDTSLIRLTQTVDSVQSVLPYSFVRDTVSSRRLFMKAQLEPGETYSLMCRKGAFSDIFGVENDSAVYTISVATEEDYGSLMVRLSGYEGRVIIQLTGDRDKVIREESLISPGELSFPLLDKGKYRLKAVCDLDEDGKWTTGDYNVGRQPEPVTYYPDELEVKINWELEQDWDIGEMYVKDVSLRSKPATRR